VHQLLCSKPIRGIAFVTHPLDVEGKSLVFSPAKLENDSNDS